jgi:hypothetical protein
LNIAKTTLFLRSRIPLGMLGIFVVLLLNLLAASPGLHQLVHADANAPEHQCAITLFAHGQVNSPVTDAPVALPAGIVETLSQYSVLIPNARAALLPPERAPPVASFNS